MREYVQKVKVLMESLKYIREFHGKIVVIKLGGATLSNKTTYQTIIEDIAMMKLTGIHPVVVHGGGVQVSEMQENGGRSVQSENFKSKFHRPDGHADIFLDRYAYTPSII